jgi:N-acetylneuraminic acid mutarotase
LSVTEYEGKLYAIGGYDRKANSAAVEVYDPQRNTWAARAPLPTPRDHLATATVSGKVYAIGGRLNGDYRRNLSVTEVYDPVTDRWALAADLPTARSGITAAEVGGRVYVFGGEGGDGTFRENEAYDPARDTWQTMALMPTGRHGLGSAVVDGRIHVISGGPTPGGSFSNLNEVFIPPEPVTSKPGGRAQSDR